MRRKIISRNTYRPAVMTYGEALMGRRFEYHLECGHTQVGDFRRMHKGQLKQPVTLNCRECEEK